MDFHPLIPIIRYINLGLLFVAIIYWTWICIKCKICGFIAPISWLVDVLAFYIFRLIVLNNPTQQNIDSINLWSSLIIGHGILLLVIVAWMAKEKVCDGPKRLPEEIEMEIKRKTTMGRYDE